MDTKFYELRIYHCEPGKLGDLINRFRDHTTGLFEKHGMTNIGYWIPTKVDNNSLYYVLSYPDRASRENSWKAFGNDEAWKAVRQKSELNGKIVKSVESIFLQTEDFSPVIKPTAKTPERIFELRTYTCLPDRLTALEDRFRNHTLKLFKKHGMTNIAYWKTVEKENVQPRLVYLLAHQSEAAAAKSFDAFRVDKKWIKARDKSEKPGKIVEKLESVFMKPLPFSNYK
ncbi:MAG: NIPSNAP family protein [Saprospiraceae bacterium]|nr:NIPSNAP family protein [Saprospiraceae bacterium]